MKLFIVMLAACSFMAGAVHAEETMGEKATAKKNDMKLGITKKTNRVKEMVCSEGDAKCLAKKGEHRAEETGTYMKNKAKEGVNNVDSE